MLATRLRFEQLACWPLLGTGHVGHSLGPNVGLLVWHLVPASCLVSQRECYAFAQDNLSGPLNRWNALLSLLHRLDRKSTPSATGSPIGRPYLALSRILTQVGVLNRLVLNRLGGPTAR